jgi:3'-phosphoadenosine 5'-phosphosulfate sulfotransferase (PAPS reductase)/FAD synthetase
MKIRVRLENYDLIVVSTSGGKDSQTMLRKVVAAATAAGVKDRVVAVHADMGQVEWPGVPELAAEQAAHHGVRFEVVSRPQGDLLQHVRDRAKTLKAQGKHTTPPVPSPNERYCTSDHKRDQVQKVIVAESKAVRGAKSKNAKVRVLHCMGMRAQESPARAELLPFRLDKRASCKSRTVHVWLPIHEMTVEQVWTDIKSSGVRHHEAYDLGMPRLSCCFCIFAPKAALVLAAKHNPELAAKYVEVEKETGFTFKIGLPMAEVVRAAEAGEDCGAITTWAM